MADSRRTAPVSLAWAGAGSATWLVGGQHGEVTVLSHDGSNAATVTTDLASAPAPSHHHDAFAVEASKSSSAVRALGRTAWGVALPDLLPADSSILVGSHYALAAAPLPVGTTYWEVKIDAVGPQKRLAVGVAPAPAAAGSDSGPGNAELWRFLTAEGNAGFGGTEQSSALGPLQAGDTVGVRVDLVLRRVTFTVNGGPAQSPALLLPRGVTAFHPAVDFRREEVVCCCRRRRRCVPIPTYPALGMHACRTRK